LVNQDLVKKPEFLMFNHRAFEKSLFDVEKYYRLLKKNKKRQEAINIILAKRLLRTKRTLVVPSHVNLTVVTNSFDIVHS
jgi:hypothetical protein